MSSKAYPGSCHCGKVQYQVRLTFSPAPNSGDGAISLYKCNCTVCQKMGFFHCRPVKPAEDFILTSPSTIEELGDYRVFTKRIGWYFCPACGVRVFGVGAQWEQIELDIKDWASGGSGTGQASTTKQKVWKSNPLPTPREDGKPNQYVSVNAVTLDQGGDIDLPAWHDKGWMGYVACLQPGEDKFRMQKPFPGGMY